MTYSIVHYSGTFTPIRIVLNLCLRGLVRVKCVEDELAFLNIDEQPLDWPSPSRHDPIILRDFKYLSTADAFPDGVSHDGRPSGAPTFYPSQVPPSSAPSSSTDVPSYAITMAPYSSQLVTMEIIQVLLCT